MSAQDLLVALGQVEIVAVGRRPKHTWIADDMSALSAASTRAHHVGPDVRGVRGLLVQGTQIVRLCVAMTVAEACLRHGKHEVATCGVIQPWNTSFRSNRRHSEGLEVPMCRGCGVRAVASKFCIKWAQDAVVVRTSAFLLCAIFRESFFPAQLPRRATFTVRCGILHPGTWK